MNPTLLPRKYLIQQDANEYTYWIVWMPAEKWAIQVSSGRDNCFFTTNFSIDYVGWDTALFDTPEAALDFWKQYIATRSLTVPRKT